MQSDAPAGQGSPGRPATAHDWLRTAGRWLLAAGLLFAGISHFRTAEEFLAQVPPWMPAPEAVVAISGVVEIGLALALVLLPNKRALVGWIVAGFFVVVFPGNISQFVTGTDAFGLDSDTARAVRLLFQPLLVVWALWCTGAWRDWRATPRAATNALADGAKSQCPRLIGSRSCPGRCGPPARWVGGP